MNKLKVIDEITRETFMKFVQEFKHMLYLEGVVQGNLTSEVMCHQLFAMNPNLPSLLCMNSDLMYA